MQGFQGVPHQHAQLRHRVGLAILEQGEEHAALVRAALTFQGLGQRARPGGIAGGELGFHLHPAPAHFRGEHQAKGLRQGAVVGFRQPLGQGQQLGQHRGVRLQGAANGAQALRGQVADLRKGHDDAFLAPGTEGHLHPLAQGKLHARGYGIGEGMGHVFMHNIHDHLGQHVFTSPQGTKIRKEGLPYVAEKPIHGIISFFGR